jgi:glycosyltransferase involved in cell wall biosynthesis
MKIVYISNSIIPSRTANSIHVMKMCQAFADNGHDVFLLAPNRYKEYEQNVNDIFNFYGVKRNFEIKKIFYKYGNNSNLFYSFAIYFYLLRNNNFDLIYGRFLEGCYISRFFKKEIIFESHMPIFHNKYFKKIIKSKYLKKIVTISNALKNIYLENTSLNEEKIQVAHDAADAVKNFDTKAKLFGNNSNLKVGYVGNLYKGKGIEIIATIADKVDKDIEFHIIGGTEEDITLWNKIINKNNVFFYGFVPQNKVSNYINSLDICLLPNQKIILPYGTNNNKKNISKFTSPLKLFEYMAHKKAIIASDLKVLREILNETNSILVDPENTSEWINAINILRNEKIRNKISEKSFSDFKKYTWRNRAKELLK